MKKIQIILTLIMAIVIGHWSMVTAQTISRKAVSTAGGTLAGGGTMLTFSIGEVTGQTLTGGSSKLTQGFEQPGEQLITGAVATIICAGNSISVPYNAIDIGVSNTFTAQLSNASGSFAAPVNIGTLSGNASGSISATIPSGTPAGAGYRIRVISNSPVATGSSNGSNITVSTLPAPIISGSNMFCLSGSTVINAGAWSGYLWSTGATTQTISVSTAATYTVTVTNASGCTGTASMIMTASTATPAQPAAITGNTLVCKSSTETYSVPLVSGATTYTWTATAGASISTGQGTNIVTVSFSNASTSASVSVVAINACGTSAPQALAYTVTSAMPSQPATINGQLNALCGMTNVAYNCPAAANATSYQWTVPAGVTLLSGQGTKAITVKYTSSFTGSGTLSVAALSGCGSSALTSKTVNAKPQQPVISGQNWACKGMQVSYSVAPVTGATSYTWTIVAGSTLVSGQGTTSITVTWGNTNGVIKCTANNNCGSSIIAQLPVSFTCKEAGENENFSALNLYPNPASTSATLQFDGYEEGKAQLALYDLAGRLIMSENVKVVTGNNEYKLDLKMLPKGVYTLRVVYNGVIRNTKLAVIQ